MFTLMSIKANWETKIFHLFSLPTLRKGCLEGFRADRVAACVSTQAFCDLLNYKYIPAKTQIRILIQISQELQMLSLSLLVAKC